MSCAARYFVPPFRARAALAGAGAKCRCQCPYQCRPRQKGQPGCVPFGCSIVQGAVKTYVSRILTIFRIKSVAAARVQCGSCASPVTNPFASVAAPLPNMMFRVASRGMAVRAASGVAARSAPRAAFDLRLVSLGAGVVAAGLFLGQQQQPSTCSAAAATTNDKITALETRLNVLEISVAKATRASCSA